MKYTLVATFDIDLNKFNPPYCVPFSVEDTTQSVIDGVKKGKIEGAESLELYQIGTFETNDGKCEVLAKPVKLAKLADYVRKAD